jgi:O-antigen/teichoic acid export membrane protein
VLGAPIAVDVLAGDDGAPSTPVLRLHGLAIVPSFLAAAAGIQLLSIRREWAVVAGNVGGLAAAFGLTFALVPALDARGAAVATVLAELVVATAVLWALMRARPATRPALRLAPWALALGALACAVGLVPGLPAVADVALGVLVYVGGLWITKRFPPEVREALGTRFGRR